jgi:hypothetical protein
MVSLTNLRKVRLLGVPLVGAKIVLMRAWSCKTSQSTLMLNPWGLVSIKAMAGEMTFKETLSKDQNLNVLLAQKKANAPGLFSNKKIVNQNLINNVKVP